MRNLISTGTNVKPPTNEQEEVIGCTISLAGRICDIVQKVMFCESVPQAGLNTEEGDEVDNMRRRSLGQGIDITYK